MLHYLEATLDEIDFGEGEPAGLPLEQYGNHSISLVDFHERLDWVIKHGLTFEHEIEGTIAEFVELYIAPFVLHVLKCKQENCLAFTVMLTSLILDAFAYGIFNDDRVGQEELLFVKVWDFRLGSVALILKESLFVESVVDGLYVFLDRYHYVTL